MSNGFICAVLTSIFPGELKPISCLVNNRNCIVNVVNISSCPLLVVLDELIMEVAFRKIICAMLVVTYYF